MSFNELSKAGAKASGQTAPNKDDKPAPQPKQGEDQKPAQPKS